MAQNLDSVTAPLATLEDRQENYTVTPYIAFLESPETNTTAQEMWSYYQDEGFRQIPKKNLHLGRYKNPLWLAITFENTGQREEWFLTFNNRIGGLMSFAEEVVLYRFINDRLTPVTHSRNGFKLESEFKPSSLTLPLTLDPETTETLLVKLQPAKAMPLHLSLELHSKASLISATDKDFQIAALFALFLILVCVFNFAIYRYTKRKNFLTLSLYSAALVLYFATADGLITLWPYTGKFYTETFLFTMFLSVSTSFFFVYRFARGNRVDTLTPALFLMAITLCLLMLVAPGIRVFARLSLYPYIIFFFQFSLLGLAFYAVKKDIPSARLLLTSFVVLTCGSLYMELAQAGFLGHEPPFPGMIERFAVFAHISLLCMTVPSQIQSKHQEQQYVSMMLERKKKLEEEGRRARESFDQAHAMRVLERDKQLQAEIAKRETERNEALRKAKEVADKLNKEQAAFFAMISHEIRTPINGMLGLLHLLLQTELDKQQADYCENIRYSSETIVALINDILDLSKLEGGHLELEYLNFDLKRVIDSVALLMSGRADEKNLAMNIQVATEVPQFVVADPMRMRQIFLNLVNNAIKFTGEGSITLVAKRFDGKDSSKTGIYFAVVDTGIGIPDSAKEKLFSAFAQVDSSTSRRFGGTGLGLNICQRLVKAMGGEIGFDSVEGKGTTFWFKLELKEGTAQAEEEEQQHQQEEPQGSEDIKPLAILVAEDNKINQQVVDGLLKSEPHQLTFVENGKQAVEMFQKNDFDIVFMDMQMPEMDGLEATRTIRASAHEKAESIPIIAMTANVLKADIQRCMDSGMNDFVAKPIDPKVLKKIIYEIATKSFKLSKDSDKPEQKQTSSGNTSNEGAQDVPTLNETILNELDSALGRSEFNELADSMLEKCKEIVATLLKNYGEGNIGKVGAEAHGLKGMTANFGMSGISTLAATIEKAVKESRHSLIDRSVPELERALAEAYKALEKWRKDN